MANSRIYFDGVAPSVNGGGSPKRINVLRGSVSEIVPFTLKTDTSGWNDDGAVLTPIGAVGDDSPNTHVRLSVDGVSWGGWGAGVTFPAFTSSGVTGFLQVQAVAGDPSTVALRIRVPQDGITQAASGTLVLGVDAGTGTDSATLAAVIPFPNATDTGSGADAASLGYGGSTIQTVPSATDTGAGTDTGNVIVIRALGSATDTGTATDTAAMLTLKPLGSATDTGAGADTGSLATAPGSATYASGTYYFTSSGTFQKGGTAPAATDTSLFAYAGQQANSSSGNMSPAVDAYSTVTAYASRVVTGGTQASISGSGSTLTNTLPNGESFANGATVAVYGSWVGNDEDGAYLYYGANTRIVVS